jgi:hypothetical protein
VCIKTRQNASVFARVTSIFEISTPKLTKITGFPSKIRQLTSSLYVPQTEAVCIKTRLNASVFACVTSIFEISAPKLTKVTYSHKFPSRVTIPPLLLLDYIIICSQWKSPFMAAAAGPSKRFFRKLKLSTSESCWFSSTALEKASQNGLYWIGSPQNFFKTIFGNFALYAHSHRITTRI